MIRAALIHVTMYPVLMPYQITVAYKCTSADIALVSGTGGVCTDVNRKLTFGRERERTSVADQWLLSYVAPTMRRDVALHGETFVANVARVRSFARVHSFVSIETALLSKSFQAQLTLKRSLARVRPHVHFQIRFAAKTRLAYCTMVGLVPRMKFHMHIIGRSGGQHLAADLARLRLGPRALLNSLLARRLTAR